MANRPAAHDAPEASTALYQGAFAANAVDYVASGEFEQFSRKWPPVLCGNTNG